MTKYKTGAQIALIVLAGWFVYAPALHGGWLWDDHRYVTENPALRSVAGLKSFWGAESAEVNYFPVMSTVQWVQWYRWGLATAGYHWTNLGLHVLSCLLLWRLLRRLGVPLAWLGGLLFAVHPLGVESVAWISELKNTLSLPLLLGAMLAYLEFDERARWGQRAPPYLCSLLLFVLAMLSKSTVAAFPAVLLLYAWWRHGRVRGRDLLASLPYFAVSAALCAVTVSFEHHRALDAAGTPEGMAARVAGGGLAIAFYLGKCLWPAGLLPTYPRWVLAPPSLLQFLPWLGIALALGWAWTRRKTWGRPVLLGGGFFLLNLAPVLGFVPMAYTDISRVADHFVYLPLVGLVGLAAAALGRMGRSRLVATGAVLGCAVLAVDARLYAANFQSQETLWSYTLRHNPDSWVAQNNLAVALSGRGDPQDAIPHYEAVRRLKPGYAAADFNLGLALRAVGRPQEGSVRLMDAVRLQPNNPDAWNALGICMVDLGHADIAIGCYQRALGLKPDDGGAANNLGEALLRLGQTAEAIDVFRHALRLDPGSPVVHYNLGSALLPAGRTAEAQAEFQEALRLRPDYPEAQRALASLTRPD